MRQTLISFVPPTETIVIETGGVEIETNAVDDQSTTANSFNYLGYNTADNSFVAASIDQSSLVAMVTFVPEGPNISAIVEE